MPTWCEVLPALVIFAKLIVLEPSVNKGQIQFWRFLGPGTLCTYLPLALSLSALLVERKLHFF